MNRYVTISDPVKRPEAAIHIVDEPFIDVNQTRCGRQFYVEEVYEHAGDPEDSYGPMCQRCFKKQEDEPCMGCSINPKEHSQGDCYDV